MQLFTKLFAKFHEFRPDVSFVAAEGESGLALGSDLDGELDAVIGALQGQVFAYLFQRELPVEEILLAGEFRDLKQVSVQKRRIHVGEAAGTFDARLGGSLLFQGVFAVHHPEPKQVHVVGLVLELLVLQGVLDVFPHAFGGVDSWLGLRDGQRRGDTAMTLQYDEIVVRRIVQHMLELVRYGAAELDGRLAFEDAIESVGGAIKSKKRRES